MAKRAYEEKNIRAIAEAIRMNTHDTATYTVAEMADGVDYVYNHGHTNGEQFGYDIGHEEGYDEGYEAGIKASEFDWEQAYDKGYVEGWTDGFSEGQESAGFDYDIAYNEGYQIGYGEGYGTGFDEGQAGIGDAYGAGYNDGYNIGVIDGKQEQYDAFWDVFQSSIGNAICKYAGNGWTADTFRPTKDIIIQGVDASSCFSNNACEVDLVEWCEMLGINIVIQPSIISSMFQNSKFTRLPEIDATLCSSLSSSIASCRNLVTVDKLKLKEDGSQTFSTTFYNDTNLQNITIEGVIGKDINFQHSKKLTKASIQSIMSHLSVTATFTVTFSQTAVNNAFTTAEWNEVIASKPANVTVSLV